MTGSERIAAAFAGASEQGRAALMPYMMGGFPDQETSLAVAAAYADAGADLVELGIPFSDPLADGPVIHAAGTTALAAGACFDTALEVGASISERLPVVAMLYANMIFAKGPGETITALADAGLAGAIVPDMPPEEAGEIAAAMNLNGLALIPLVAPTTPTERRKKICATAQGFIYVVSDTRTTGERDELPEGLTQLIEATRADSPVPVAVGFGIGTPEQAATVGRKADGVIVGTRLVREVSEATSPAEAAKRTGAFIEAAAEAMAAARVG